MNANQFVDELKKKADESQAKVLSGFFKTGKGQYGEGDIFWGIKVPVIRIVAKDFIDLDLKDVEFLLCSKIHEIRFAALYILIEKYKKADEGFKKIIFNLYLKNIKKNINNWDLVDLSCPHIIGDFLFEKDRDILYDLAKSENLWEKRVVMISTFNFIKKGDFGDTLALAEILLFDKHDLINKAVGWMLREVGKRNKDIEIKFLEKYSGKMPRTALRYAIEKFDEKERKYYLNTR